MRVRIKDVAERAGVSTATVSRVLANKPPISVAARRRVEQAVAELGYRPNRLARSLRTRQSRTIGVIIPDIQNPFFLGIVRAIQDLADERQFTVFLCNTDESARKEERCAELMQAESVAGVIVAPAQELDAPCRKLTEIGIPMVVVDRRLGDLTIDSVAVDNVGAARALVSHLIEDGFNRIAAVLGTPSATTGRERKEGYLQAMAEAALPVPPDFLRSGPSDGINGEAVGYELTRELLDRPAPPTALFTGTNLLTLGALRAIFDRGLRIPDDIAVVAFDEINWMSVVRPPLTVAAQPVAEIGATAARLLMRRIDDPGSPPTAVVLEPTLIIRQSCAHHAMPTQPASDRGAGELAAEAESGSIGEEPGQWQPRGANHSER